MSKMFRGKFIQLLESQYQQRRIVWEPADWSVLLKNICQAGFNVFSRMGFSNPDHIIKYLGRYSHRVAITNQRIVNVNDKTVSFWYKDYRDGKKKVLNLSPEQFVQRFLLHVLPKRFAKIRHYGILANRDKTVRVARILYFFERRKLTQSKATILKPLLGKQPVALPCPICEEGQLMVLQAQRTAFHIRGSPKEFRTKDKDFS